MITFELDAETRRALDVLTADGTSVPEAVRTAVRDTARRREEDRHRAAELERVAERLRAETAAVAADPEDRAEVRRVMADMK